MRKTLWLAFQTIFKQLGIQTIYMSVHAMGVYMKFRASSATYCTQIYCKYYIYIQFFTAAMIM